MDSGVAHGRGQDRGVMTALFTMSEAAAWKWAADLTRGVRPAGSDAPDLTPDWAPEKDDSGAMAEHLVQAAGDDGIIVMAAPYSGHLILKTRIDDSFGATLSITGPGQPILHLGLDRFMIESLGDRGQVGTMRAMSILREVIDGGNLMWRDLNNWKPVKGAGNG